MLVKLKDICEIKSSKRIFESEYVTSGVPFIRGQEVSEKTLFKANSYNCYITEKRYTELKNKYGVPKRGDILITAVGTVGNVCYIDSDLKFYYKDGNLIQLTNFKNNINSLYLYYYLQSKYFQKQLNNILIGAVQKALTMSMLNEIVISIPPKNIQEKIVKILRFFDKQIECCEDMVKRLQVMGQAIFQYFFVNNKKEKTTLKKVSRMYQPETISSKDFVVNGKYNVYGSGGIIGKYDKYNHANSELMISCRGLCSNISFSLPYSWIIGNQMVIKTEDENLKYYLFNYLNNINLKSIETGSVQKQITRKNLENLTIELIENNNLIYLNKKLKLIYNMISTIEIFNEKIKQLKNKLLPLLINQQII